MTTTPNTDRSRTALVSAALRHVRDAEHLAGTGAHQSIDQAFHLAGFGPECVRKACLHERWADLAIGHGFDEQTEVVLDIALSLDTLAHRYRPEQWLKEFPFLPRWTVHSRYWRTGQADPRSTRELVDEARRAVDAVVSALWADGLLHREALL